jgi:hypothetical protein
VSIKIEKDLQDALRKRAVGYDYEEQEICQGKGGESKVRIVRKHVPPDTTAIRMIREMIELGEWLE